MRSRRSRSSSRSSRGRGRLLGRQRDARRGGARLRPFEGEDGAPVTAEAFEALPHEPWPELRLGLHPSVSLLAVGANVREVWLAVRAGRPPSTLRSARERLVVWRASGGAQVEVIAEGWHRLLASLARDATLAATC